MTGDEIDQALDDLALIGLGEWEGDIFKLDPSATLDFLARCVPETIDYIARQRRIGELRQWLEEDPDRALSLVVTPCLLTVLGRIRERSLGVLGEKAYIFHESHIIALAAVFVTLLRKTDLYGTALRMIQEVAGIYD